MEPVSPQEIDACLRVLARVASDPTDPALAEVRRSVDLAYRSVKKQRRSARRADRREHDLALMATAVRHRQELPPVAVVADPPVAVVADPPVAAVADPPVAAVADLPARVGAAPAPHASSPASATPDPSPAPTFSPEPTSSPGQAVPPASSPAPAPMPSPTPDPSPTPAAAATLRGARPCYICKADYRRVDAEYHMLCPACAAENLARRHARCDLTGRRALLTGGRIKIGFHTALKLLRDGAEVLITTRFPRDAARRYAAVPDASDWIDRLWIHGVDFLNLSEVLGLVEAVRDRWGTLDILVNNAAQTIARPPEYHREVRDAETAPLHGKAAAIALTGAAAPRSLTGAASVTGDALVGWFPAGERDETGEPLDLRPRNSWVLRVDEVSPREWLEVHVVNAFVPFLLTGRLRPLLLRSPHPDRYVVQVSAMEGSFARERKTSRHPHTNMAKAALNMLTRTVAEEYAADGIYMSSVDTGWVTDERPHASKQHHRAGGFRPPLDVIDGAARVYDPIVRGVRGEPVYGVFLKDYGQVPW